MQRSELGGLWRVVGQLNGPSTSAPIVNGIMLRFQNRSQAQAQAEAIARP